MRAPITITTLGICSLLDRRSERSQPWQRQERLVLAVPERLDCSKWSRINCRTVAAPLQEARTFWHAQYDVEGAAMDVSSFLHDVDGAGTYAEPIRVELGGDG